MLSSVHMWSNLFGEHSLIGEQVLFALLRASSCKVTCHGFSRATLSMTSSREALIPRPDRAAGDGKAPMQIMSLEPGGRVGVANGWNCVLVKQNLVFRRMFLQLGKQLPREQPPTAAASSIIIGEIDSSLCTGSERTVQADSEFFSFRS